MGAIEIEQLNKSYRTGFGLRRTQVLFDLSLKVLEGEIYGFIGPNGAGKTTTLKILMGLSRLDSGRVRIFGQDVSGVEHKREVGFLPERPYFYEYLTAREFLDFYGRLFNLPAADRRRRIDVLLERVSLGPHRDTPLHRYSKGMLQRVGIAQALINDPQLVVLDEPMSGLDPLGRMLIRDLIVELKQQGRTVFFSTHILSDVELVCDRVGILVAGRTRDEGTLDELLAHRLRFIEVIARAPEAILKELEQRLRPLSEQSVLQGERLLVRASDEERKAQVIREVLQAGAELESVVPRRESLEDLFLDELEAVRRTGKGG